MLSKGRMKNGSVEVMDSYFGKLKQIYDDLNLHNRPEAIFNMDETYFGRKQEGYSRRTIGNRGGDVPKQ